ncbi:DegT/DnrJ/EryC1/StrS family aminotransferase [Echinimonas agarilytica]|uniref:DegT/DnrJ/EryC1/StrS aminotransferase family protein n=1 Tax=Echinimonas agarilytica TaxID=1215918 RepID=A0AA41W4X9_9GAMM|nr:DegT/DnrJ/EryC1/StrS aminotransferase family protein [Echinimonas agarilytica]MCM2678916.1 DegT/DnrJ/EryC1/StrS aminotransferase family protein [Echinimonas agarilytica]
MLNTPYSPWPSFTQEEADAVQRVLLSNKVNYWTGQEGREFEKEFAAFSDCKYAVAVANGTVALDLAFHAIGLGEGDEVIVTSRTFLASVSSIVNAGAIPVFADVDRQSQNITADTIRPHITEKTKAIVCVHLAGWPCDMDEILALAKPYEIKVVEDCAQAHGAKYKGRSVGGLGHIAAWSFCQDKIMSTGGEGGIVTTNDEALWKRAWAFKDHGKSFDKVYNTQHPPGFRWLHDSFGTNWRLTEMQSAIGRIQLKRMPQWTSIRQRHAKALNDALKQFEFIRIPDLPDDIEHACYKHYVFVEPSKLSTQYSRDQLMAELNEAGVPTFSGSCSEVYLEDAFAGSHLQPEQRLKMAQELGETSLMFLVHPTLEDCEIGKFCDGIKQVLTKVSP